MLVIALYLNVLSKIIETFKKYYADFLSEYNKMFLKSNFDILQFVFVNKSTTYAQVFKQSLVSRQVVTLNYRRLGRTLWSSK